MFQYCFRFNHISWYNIVGRLRSERTFDPWWPKDEEDCDQFDENISKNYFDFLKNEKGHNYAPPVS